MKICEHLEGTNIQLEDADTCPYAMELYNDDEKCICCESCQYNCAQDI